jgi:molybdate transport system substrate-binding protein
VRVVAGSSGNFTRQILQGAPFEVFFSADEEYVRQLARAQAARDEGTLYAIGRLALLVPNGSPLRADGTLEDLRAALAAGRVTRFSIANPEHAPYGKRAEEALRHAGLWEAIRPRLVLGENVSQAAQFAASGNAQAGLVAYSLALSPKVSVSATHALVPDAWHAPLRQRMVLTRKAGVSGERFYAFMQAGRARAILARHGFVLPGEAR